MEKTEWYFEYELQYNRPGMLGDISSLLGMLSINIMMINGIEDSRRGMLLLSQHDENIERLQTILDNLDSIEKTKLRKPEVLDILAVRHGKYIHRDREDRKTVRSEEHTSELQSRGHLVCRLLLEKKKKKKKKKASQKEKQQSHA